MKLLYKGVAIISGICFLIIILISSVEYAAYGNIGFYEDEFEKYNVNKQTGIVNMSMDELIKATQEMMSYLRGDREDMIINVEIDGIQKQMFNDVEIYHMVDVRSLFVKALTIRILCLFICILGFLFLVVMRGVKDGFYIFLKHASRLIVLTGALFLVIGLASFVNFSAVFTRFHGIFFVNQGWILDGKISRLINILPEGFFTDMALRIGKIYFFANLVILVLQSIVKRVRIGTIN